MIFMEKHNTQFIGQFLGLLEKAVKESAPKERFGVLFSGGVDSSTIALMCKKIGMDFCCYMGIVEEKNRRAKDAEFAKRAAKSIGAELRVKSIPVSVVEKKLEKIAPIVKGSVVDAGVALPILLACERAKEDGIKTVLSGMGADELFAGYDRFRPGKKANEECRASLEKLLKNDLQRDKAICKANGIELHTPFLQKDIVNFALDIPPQMKIDKKRKKIILRELAKKIGLKEEFAERKKVAAQYGSNADWAIEKLAKKNGCKTKTEYLKKFYQNQNLVLGALVSGGKDSLLAMQTMQKQQQ